MANVEVEAPPVSLPDYLLDPNAVLKDISANWRYGQAPDYSETRKVYGQSTSFLSFDRINTIAALFRFSRVF
jgi:hypothetical protein